MGTARRPRRPRLRGAEAAVRAIPPDGADAVRPHDRAVRLARRPALRRVAVCARGAPDTGRPVPGRPTLVLSGEDDLRTPLESARRDRRADPRGEAGVVPEMGHSRAQRVPAGLRPASRRRLLRRPGAAPLPAAAPEFPPVPIAPRSLREVSPDSGHARPAGPNALGGGADADRRARPGVLGRAARFARPDVAQRRRAARGATRVPGCELSSTPARTCPACG